jgi:hypothetical protein
VLDRHPIQSANHQRRVTFIGFRPAHKKINQIDVKLNDLKKKLVKIIRHISAQQFAASSRWMSNRSWRDPLFGRIKYFEKKSDAHDSSWLGGLTDSA